MEELIQQLVQKARLSPEQAEQAANIFIDFVKSKIPPALHGNIETILGTAGDNNSGMSGWMDKAKDFLD
jgi:hypothetical protein